MGNVNLTAVDVVVLVVLLASAGFAFLRGFVQEVLSITSWVGAAFAALYGFSSLQPFFRAQIGTGWIADAATGATLFLCTLLILSILTKTVADRVRGSALNSVDRSLGFMFGLLRGGVLLSLAYLSAAWLFEQPDQQPAWLSGARSHPWLERGATMLKSFAPESLTQAEGQTRRMSAETRQMIEAEQSFQKFVSPLPAMPAAPAAEGGAKAASRPAPTYDSESRTQMDRLIRGKQ